jgi:PAS domain S-box-containing protein
MATNKSYEELKTKIDKLEKKLSNLKNAEQSLKKERDFNYEVLYWTDSLVIVIDLNGFIITFNRASENLSGYRFEELQYKPFWDILLAPEEREGVKSAIRDVIDKGIPDKFQNMWVTKDGSKRLINWRNSILRKPDGSIEYILSTGRDITEQERVEEALRRSEIKYRELVQHANSIILRFDIQGRITFCNEFAQRFFGYTEKEILHKNIIGMIVPETESSGRNLAAMLEDIIQNSTSYNYNENENIRRDGERAWIAWTNKAILDRDENISEILSIGIDITDRKKAGDALKESEATLKSIFRAAPTGIGMVSNRIIERVNQRLCEMVGYSADELIGQSARIFYPSEEEFRWVGEEKYGQITKWGTGAVETHWKRKDGSIIDVLLSSTPIDPAEPTKEVTFTALDITESKKAENALRQSEKRYKTLTNNLHIGIFRNTTGSHGKFLEANPAIVEMFGFQSRDEFMRMSAADLYQNPDNRKKFNEQMLKFGFVRDNEVHLRKKDGTPFIGLVSAVTVRDETDEVTYYDGIIEDITGKKELELQLQQAQKMEAIGALAGGIAHDFNNILSAIMGYTELALNDVEKESTLHNNLGEVFLAGIRAKDLVKQILTFSRQTEQERKPLQVNLIVKEALKLLRATLPATIDIRENIQTDGLVIGDATQIHQVLMNLCTNAGHAMQDKGGLLKIGLTKVELGAGTAANYPELKPGFYLEMTVGDTGHGMASHVLDRIFDPFFTTKEKGRGTGMGLAVVHGIVKSHGGEIYVSSAPNKGATFKVYFPAVKRHEYTASRIEKPMPTGTERILLVDDEPAIASVGKKNLESLGYEVTTRTSSVEALELFKHQPDRFDLVVTDMTMPKITGENLARKLMRIRSDIPIILCTGYSANIDEQQATSMGIRAYVLKPLVLREIAKAVREVLDGK